MGFGHYDSPIGRIFIQSNSERIKRISFDDEPGQQLLYDPLIDKCILQLSEYFEGKRTAFDVPYEINLTDFQREVLRHVARIPFGSSTSYLDIAKSIGNPGNVRAVGTANARNPVLIVVPCHRVIGTNGELTGYAGGLHRKEWLLRHEGNIQQLSLF